MKVFRGIRIVFAALTGLFGIYSAYALYGVWGDKLLYSDVEMGRWLSLTYKWALIIFVVLLLIDLALAAYARKRKKLKA